MKITQAISLTIILAASPALAERDHKLQEGREHRQPPQVALDACGAAVAGDPCSFTGRREKTLEGTCETVGDEVLACRPDRPRREDHLKRRDEEPDT